MFGFGVDSFIEVMSGIGIAMMIIRIRQNPESSKSTFEIKALKITGTAFYLLSVAEGKEAFEKAQGKECSCDHCETKLGLQ